MLQIQPTGVKMKGIVAIAFVLLLAFTFVPMIAAAAGDNSPPSHVAILLQTPSSTSEQAVLVVQVASDADSKSATDEQVINDQLIGDSAPNIGMADRLPHTRDQTS
jgi:hypothetical protein